MFLHSVSLHQGKYSIISNKDIYIYFWMFCIPGNNLNELNSIENIAFQKSGLDTTYVWGKLSIGTC